MRTMNYNGDVRFLKPIVDTWFEESNGDVFGLDVNADIVLGTMQDLANQPSSTLMLLLDDDIVVGFMGVLLYHSPVSPTLMANENFWYVLPKHRGAASLRLMKAAKKWAKDAGATHVTMSASKLASVTCFLTSASLPAKTEGVSRRFSGRTPNSTAIAS